MATTEGPAPRRRRLGRNESGNAAIEFAFVMPLMIVIYVGVVVLADGVMTSRNLSNLTRTLVDMVSKQATSAQATSTPAPSSAIPSLTLDGIFNASQTLIYPQPTGPLQMTVSAVDVTNTLAGICCKVLVRWTYTKGGSLRPCGTQLTASTGSSLALTEFPSSLLPYGTVLSQPMSYIVADTNFTYQALVASDIAPSFNVPMARYEISMPRSAGQVITQALPAAGAMHGLVCY